MDSSAAGQNRVENIRIDSVNVRNSGGHGMEAYGVDGLTVGEFVGDHTGDCGLMLNNTVDMCYP